MEDDKYDAWVYYLVIGKRPSIFSGTANKQKWKNFKRYKHKYKVTLGYLFRFEENEIKKSDTTLKFVVKQSWLAAILKKYHDDLFGGAHEGRDRMVLKIGKHYWFKGLHRICLEKSMSCSSCQQAKPQFQKMADNPYVPTAKGDRIIYDFTGPYPTDVLTGDR